MAEESQKIVVTNKLKVEIFYMPVIDLSLRFGYRFVEPMPMIWQLEGRFAHTITIPFDRQRLLKDYLMQRWKEIIFNSKHLAGEGWETLKWLEDVNEIELVECDITRKAN